MRLARRASPLLLEGLALLLGVLALGSAVPAVFGAWVAVVFHALPHSPEQAALSRAASALAVLFWLLPSLAFACASILIRFFVARRE